MFENDFNFMLSIFRDIWIFYRIRKVKNYKMGIVYKSLGNQHLSDHILKEFNRYQEVKRCWRKENNKWYLRDIAFIEQWNEQDKREIIQSLRETIAGKGVVYGAFEENILVGFASVEGLLIGSRKQYAILHHIYTSYGYRGQGIGKKLFTKSCEFAKNIGAEKLYISAHSSEESQLFYKGLGCKDAEEIDDYLYQLEPVDCHMELILSK